MPHAGKTQSQFLKNTILINYASCLRNKDREPTMCNVNTTNNPVNSIKE